MTVAILGMNDFGRSLARGLAGRIDLVLGVANPHAEQRFCADLPGGVLPTDYRTAARVADTIVVCMPAQTARLLLPDLQLNSGQTLLVPVGSDGVVADELPVRTGARMHVIPVEAVGDLTPEFVVAAARGVGTQ